MSQRVGVHRKLLSSGFARGINERRQRHSKSEYDQWYDEWSFWENSASLFPWMDPENRMTKRPHLMLEALLGPEPMDLSNDDLEVRVN